MENEKRIIRIRTGGADSVICNQSVIFLPHNHHFHMVMWDYWNIIRCLKKINIIGLICNRAEDTYIPTSDFSDAGTWYP